MTNSPVEDAEALLRELAAELTTPLPGECLLCYVHRMLEHGCRGLRWAPHYRDLRAPRATALEKRLRSAGGGCDCEIFWNVFELCEEWMHRPRVRIEEARLVDGDLEYPDPMPACRGARAGSTKPCELWRKKYRWRYGY